MIKRIELINFMSHPRTVIEPAEGLTVLVGENNTGKSAVVAALEALSRNASGDFMVRHGERECVVRVETDDGHVLEWRRKGAVVSYTLDGRDVHRLRGSVPDDLHELLRMPSVEAEGGTFDIHFGQQKKPVFLLDESPGRRAAFFASSSDTAKLLQMQSLHRARVRKARDREADLARREARLQKRLELLEPLDRLGEALRELEHQHETLLKREDLARATGIFATRLEDAGDKLLHWSGRDNALGPLSRPPALRDTTHLSRWIDEAEILAPRIREEEARRSALEDLPPPPSLVPVRHLEGLTGQMVHVLEEIRRGQSLEQAVARLEEPPEPADTTKLRKALRLHQRASMELQRLAGLDEALSPLEAPPPPRDTAPLASTIALVRQTAAEAERVSKLESALEPCRPPPEIRDPASLSGLVHRLEAARREHGKSSAFERRLEEIPSPPAPRDPEALRKLVLELESAGTQSDGWKDRLLESEKTLAQVEAALRECAHRQRICPTCGQPLDGDRMVESMRQDEGRGRKEPH